MTDGKYVYLPDASQMRLTGDFQVVVSVADPCALCGSLDWRIVKRTHDIGCDICCPDRLGGLPLHGKG